MATTDATKQVDAIKSDIDTLREDISSLMQDMSALRKVAASEAKTKLDGHLSDAAAKAAAARDDIADVTSRQVEGARQTVQDNPIASVAAAFGLGLLAARLIK